MGAGIIPHIREKIALLMAWHTRSQAEQKRIAAFVLVLSVLVPLFVWSWLNVAVSQARTEREEIISRYERALPLTADISSPSESSDTKGDQISPLALAQKVMRDAGLDNRLASIRPAQELQGRDGVQLYLENMNLPELLHLFSGVQQQSGLHIVSCDLKRRMDNSRRMDARLILGE